MCVSRGFPKFGSLPILYHFHLACIMPHCGRYHHTSAMQFMAQKIRMINLPGGEKVWWQVWQLWTQYHHVRYRDGQRWIYHS